MSTFNTTYNFNQRNMNFGEAMLSGMFSNMGGCFGGYGSPFSMGGSLFSMMGCGFGGFGGYGCYGTDQSLGFQLGIMGVNMATGLVDKLIEGKGKDEETPDLITLQSKSTTLGSEIKSLGAQIDDLNANLDDSGNIPDAMAKACPTEAAAYKAAFSANAKISQDSSINNADKEEAAKKLSSAKTALIDAAAKKSEELKALKSKKETEKSAIETDIKNIKEAEEHKKLLKEINKNDGVASARTREKKLKDQVKYENGKYTYQNTPTLQDVQGAFARYRKADSDTDKLKWAKVLVAMSEADADNVFNSNYKNLLNRVKKEQHIS